MLTIAVTERARKLRAHYALQVQDLRARIERRVNRIPVALRKATMGELLEKHNAVSRTAAGARDFKKPPMPSKAIRNPALTISVDIGNRDSTSATTKSQNRRVKPPKYVWFYFVVKLQTWALQTTNISLATQAAFPTRRMPPLQATRTCLSTTPRSATIQMRREPNPEPFPK